MKKVSYTQQLRDKGFDRSSHVLFTKLFSVKCSQCEALVINGIPTHETGCPNIPKKEREEDDEDVDTTPIQYGPPHGGW